MVRYETQRNMPYARGVKAHLGSILGAGISPALHKALDYLNISRHASSVQWRLGELIPVAEDGREISGVMCTTWRLAYCVHDFMAKYVWKCYAINQIVYSDAHGRYLWN